MFRFMLSIIILIFATTAVLLIISLIQSPIFTEVYTAMPSDIDIFDNSLWTARFSSVAIYATLLAAFGTLIWLLAGQFFYRINRIESAGGRRLWLSILGVLLLLTLIGSAIFIPATQDFGRPIAMLFIFINALIVFWGSSSVGSPSGVKYAPWGSFRMASSINRIVRMGGGSK